MFDSIDDQAPRSVFSRKQNKVIQCKMSQFDVSNLTPWHKIQDTNNMPLKKVISRKTSSFMTIQQNPDTFTKERRAMQNMKTSHSNKFKQYKLSKIYSLHFDGLDKISARISPQMPKTNLPPRVTFMKKKLDQNLSKQKSNKLETIQHEFKKGKNLSCFLERIQKGRKDSALNFITFSTSSLEPRSFLLDNQRKKKSLFVGCRKFTTSTLSKRKNTKIKIEPFNSTFYSK